jgi:uncharacterized protein YndB with AHSA1/START domain
MKLLFALVGALLIAAVTWIAMQPSSYAITRSETIAAPPSAVFPAINSLKRWQSWSPWAKLDPNVVETYEGPEQGVGAIMKWSGNADVGKGGMAIVESVPDQRVKLRLDFAEPMNATSFSEFTLAPDAANTRVTWTMTGERGFVEKAAASVMSIDDMVGGQFAKGLQNLKSVAEQAPAP